MGLFKGLRTRAEKLGNIAGAYKEMAAQAEQAAANAPLAIINPTPQAEVDRLLESGGVARGVVVRATHAAMEDGERVANMRVDILVRSRLANGELGQPVKLAVRTSSRVAALLDPGLEIPIMLDRTTGTATEIPSDLLSQELQHRFDEADRRRPGWGSDVW